jgi:2-O-methyltransferase
LPHPGGFGWGGSDHLVVAADIAGMPGPIHDLLATIIDPARPLNIIECGCHEGWDTRELRKRFPLARIIALEPDPRNVEFLNTRGVSKLAEIVPAAIADKDGRAMFHLSGADLSAKHPEWIKGTAYAGSSSLKPPAAVTKIHEWLTFDESVEVDTVTLDTLAARSGMGLIDFVWADVQGAEDLLIAGGQKALARTRYLYTEFSNQEEYKDQIPLSEIVARLPGTWSIVRQYDYDVLLKNETLAAELAGSGNAPYVRHLASRMKRPITPEGLTVREIAQQQAEALWIAHGQPQGRPKPEFRSQNGEDVLLWMLFHGKPEGQYIEVGAFDGYSFSVSYVFESVGWSGLLVEALPERHSQCKDRRSRFSRVVHAALGPAGSSGTAEFTLVDGGEMLSYLNLTEGHKTRLARETTITPRTVQAPLTSMDNLLADDPARGAPGAIDFAVIDVEGGEEGLLKGFDLARLRPRVLLVEDNTFGKDTTVRKLMESHGYVCVGNLEANDLFILNSEVGLIENYRRWFC